MRNKEELGCTCYSWTSIRHGWPYDTGLYDVKDCRHDCEGLAYYNGFDWEGLEMMPKPKGSLFLPTYIITHWRFPVRPVEN